MGLEASLKMFGFPLDETVLCFPGMTRVLTKWWRDRKAVEAAKVLTVAAAERGAWNGGHPNGGRGKWEPMKGLKVLTQCFSPGE